MWVALYTVLEVAGIVAAMHAIFYARSAQGSTAWAVSLLSMPLVAVPLYLFLGRNKFQGYVNSRRSKDREARDTIETLRKRGDSYVSRIDDERGALRSLEELAHMPFTCGNSLTLLIDGQETFDAIFREIDAAERYLLVQFFIVHDDDLGRRLRDRLIARAKAGVKVRFLYDEIGSHQLSSRYIEECRAGGIDLRSFHTTKGKRNRFQVNFRNHRKIVIADGRVALIGGHNVGDEYLGKGSRFGSWRDTHVRIEGPAALGVQVSFLEDWNWAAGEGLPEASWEPRASDNGDQDVLIMPSGPADDLETCSLMFVQALHSAKKRIWIASPYFVPNDEVLSSIQVAGLRGVDVRILLPANPDHYMVYLASFSYLRLAGVPNVRIYRYRKGFMHQKVFLVDDVAGAVGTANLDNRSFRLNFEITAICLNGEFSSQVEEMFLRDFERSDPADPNELENRNLLFQFAAKLARLFSPIL